MTKNINFSKRSLAISAILVSSLSIGAAFGADEPKPHDATDQARSIPTTALDIAASATGQSFVVPSVLIGPDGRPEAVKRPAPAPAAPKNSTRGGQISRAEVIRRAKYWFDSRLVYNPGGSHRDPDSASHTYRRDCSGLVSMALHLTSSLNTETLLGVGMKIAATAMQPGDFIGVLGKGTAGLHNPGHVRVFEKWANKSTGTYWAYDFGGTPVKHMTYNIHEAPRKNKAGKSFGWTAYRYKKII